MFWFCGLGKRIMKWSIVCFSTGYSIQWIICSTHHRDELSLEVIGWLRLFKGWKSWINVSPSKEIARASLGRLATPKITWIFTWRSLSSFGHYLIFLSRHWALPKTLLILDNSTPILIRLNDVWMRNLPIHLDLTNCMIIKKIA